MENNLLLICFTQLHRYNDDAFWKGEIKVMKEDVDALLMGKNHVRSLPFSGVKNFRDLGGYRTRDGRSVRWGHLYRSDSLHKLTNTDIKLLTSLNLSVIIDFRAKHEVEREPDRLPTDVKLLKLPMEDASTKVWHEAREEMVKNMRNLDPAKYMVKTNVELATKFTPEYILFHRELLAHNGRPMLFHCAAGKDRTGFAAATILKILGVDWETIMQDYLLTNNYLLNAYKWEFFMARIVKGRKFVEGIHGFMKADERYLSAAFLALEREHGSFENYVRNGLKLTDKNIEQMKNFYLE